IKAVDSDQRIAMDTLENVEIGDCKLCKLCDGRSSIVFGVGSPSADIVFIGEAPGAEEDRLGEPFVGRSGKLLTKMIEAMGLSREQVYICNVVKCRPPLNRNPEKEEVLACEPFLKKQLAIIKPKVIVTLGRYATQCLVKSNEKMSDLRGKWQVYENIPLLPTFHPAYLLRSPSKKKDTWEDLQKALGKI
ncbi:MAG: uracil-DNA glycosylase, partial [bacterium]|nr:uracil-DNA glycosylase [bacterium]